MTKRIFFGVLAVMIVGSETYGAVSDHVLSIEISTTYDYDFPDVGPQRRFSLAKWPIMS